MGKRVSMPKRYYTASFHNGGRKEDSKDTKGNGKAVKFQANREHNIRDAEYCKNQEHIGFKNKTEQEHEDWAKTHILHDEKVEDAYERIFGEAVKKYDEKQKRSDRKIGSGKKYYEKLKKSKNKVPVYEFIITLGNKDNLPDNPEEVRQIYIEALNTFKTRNPNFEVIGAYYHDDESRDDGKGGKVQGAPHLHVDYIPVSRNRWRTFIDKQNKKDSLFDKLTGKEIKKKTRVNGLDVENSLTEALAAQGFISRELDLSVIEKKFGIHISAKHYKDSERQAQYEYFMSGRLDKNGKQIKTRLLTAQMQWIKNERDCLIRLFEKHGYKIKNPGEHRPHLETQDFIESKDMNIQERNLELYNELSSKIDFIEAEEKELYETKKALFKKEEILTQKETNLTVKEDELNKKEIKQKQKDEYLNSKTQIVVEAESRLEEAKQINKETKAYRNDIEQIRADLYQEIKADVNKDYKSKYQELYNIQKYQEEKEVELKKQKKLQDETERQQKEKARELFQRELNVANLETYKKRIEDKEEAISEREKDVELAEKSKEEKKTALKLREETLQQNQKDLDEAVKQFKTDCKNADKFYETQKTIYEENEKFMTGFRKEYREKTTEINEWEEALIYTKENNTDTWIDSEFKDCLQKKQSTQNLIQKIKQGIKGVIARVKKLYDEKIRNYEKKLNGYDFIDEKGESMHSFGCAEIQKMFLDDTNPDTFRQIADDMEKESVNNYTELYKRKPQIIEKHFEYARERTRENTLHW